LAKDDAVKEDGGELMISFTCEVDAEKRKQVDLNQVAAQAIYAQKVVNPWLAMLRTPAPTEKDLTRTLLEKRLRDYTARNTFDYFIHKNLGKFLRRELDFFIKNEVMHLDDVEVKRLHE